MAKYTIDFGPKSEKVLAHLAESQETSKANVIRRAVGVLAALTEEVEKGTKILFQSPDGTIRHVIAP